MRPGRRVEYEEPLLERAGGEDLDGPAPLVERAPEPPVVSELRTAADRAAARRRLDRLAEEF